MTSRKWTDKDLIRAILESDRWIEVQERLEVSTKSESGKAKLKARATELGVDWSHLSTTTKYGYRKYSDSIFRKGVNYTVTIRRYFLESVEYKCAAPGCGLNEWRGQPITLQVDHIDGDTTNNLRENLRLLCPNCHTQTDSWGVPKPYREVSDRKTTTNYKNGRSEFIAMR